MKTNCILFDLAETLIHKPGLYCSIRDLLCKRGISIPLDTLTTAHKHLSEVIFFPSSPSKEFYISFNQKFLRLLGIYPSAELCEEVFAACRRLTWKSFSDTSAISDLKVPIGIVSNWGPKIDETLAAHFFGIKFSCVISSFDCGYAKPDPTIFRVALDALELEPSSVMYVGNSIGLDILPAQRACLNAVLVDRDNSFGAYSQTRITSLDELHTIVEK